MSDTTVTTAPAPAPVTLSVPPAATPAPTPAQRPWTVQRVLKSLASLRLTVVLFALSLGLVFFGTLAQMNAGIWTVVGEYFRSLLVWVPFQLFVQFGQVFFAFPKSWHLPGAFPFPGGWALGAALLLNLVA